ncbi:MAG TPA: pilus assembly protein PilM [Candidatus Udaeobacter sp.]|nr:pilus assembly protein PilM [Candidatus Udaeobacter sp.]
MFLQNPFSDAFGINIGDLSIKLVQLAPSPFYQKQYFKIRDLRSTSLPPGLIVNGEIQQPELVLKKLNYILGKEGDGYKKIGSSWAVANLPEAKSFLKLIDVEGTDNSLTSVDVAYQAKKHLPFELEDAYLDWQVISPTANDTKKQILVGAVQKTIVDSYVNLFESAGLNLVALETEAIAVSRSMITDDKDYTGQARAILDLGGARSNLVIYDHNSIQFSATLNFSGEIVTAAIAQALKIDRAEAESLKVKNGLKYDTHNPKYLPAVSSIAENLISEIKTNLLFYKEHFNNTNAVSHITLCGGMSNWENIDDFISRQLKISAHLGHPWKNLHNKRLYDYEQNKSLAFACAIGLALRASQNQLQNNLHAD